MALGIPVASTHCMVGSVARFDILGMEWRNGRARVGFMLGIVSLDLISIGKDCLSDA